jgi:hypothetical protein
MHVQKDATLTPAQVDNPSRFLFVVEEDKG